jgi:thiol-disulfide isomerase/thioredoxin
MGFEGLGDMLAARPLLAIPLVFAGGLLTSLTPCIYPMIPITAAVVGGQSDHGDGRSAPKGRVIALTMAYVVGLALAYASLGLLAGLTGTLFGGISTNPWLQLLIANLLLIFAFMMFEVIPVPVPRRLWATWCPLCRKLEPAFAEAVKANEGRVRFIRVGVPDNQSAEKQKAYVDEKGIGGEHYFDGESAAVKAYAVPHTSYIVATDATGKVVYTGVGADEDLKAIVARALDALPPCSAMSMRCGTGWATWKCRSARSARGCSGRGGGCRNR